MSGAPDPSLRGLNDCGCCSGVGVETPANVHNRPGLSAIAYRIGTQPQFKASMLARLSGSDLPALAGLTTRDDDDFSIALIDAWATVADVLTFYQERIANESYLRTATERMSLLDLARLIGYELRPGVAASVDLAFTLEDAVAPGVPRLTTIPIGTAVRSIPGPGEQPQTFETIEEIQARPEWNALKARTTELVLPRFGSRETYLQGTSNNLKVGDALLFVDADREGDATSDHWDFRTIASVDLDRAANRTHVHWNEPLGKPFSPPASLPKCYVFRQRTALFGANAPDFRTMSKEVQGNYLNSGGSEWPNFNIAYAAQVPATLDTIYLDAIYPKITANSWVCLTTPSYVEVYQVDLATADSQSQFALSGKSTRLKLKGENLAAKFGSFLRETVVFGESELLEYAEQPLVTPVAGNQISLATAVAGLQAGQRLIVSGTPIDSPNEKLSESVELSAVNADGTGLTFAGGLERSYVRETVTLYANVAAATNGESKTEVLGSGDASQAFQKFVLKQAPLTYVAAAGASGSASTLEVRVNDLLWHEVASFYGRGPRERIFVTRTGDDGKTTVEFGDGKTGARLPTGRENVTAHYRKGIGTGGNVAAEQLSLLMSRPLGVKSVLNPAPAAGAADRETLAGSRQNAPLTVLTLDRIVSLQDYEDFAHAFAGVAKALATWTWSGQQRGVFVTIAGPNGAAIEAGTATHDNLIAAMKAAGDPYVPLRAQTFRPAFFKLGANVKCDPDFESEKVFAAIEQTLRVQFSFDAREFGQAVSLGEILATIQNVPGVLAVDATRLYRADDPAGPATNDILLAAAPQAGAGALPGPADDLVLPAELLTLDPGPLDQLGVLT